MGPCRSFKKKKRRIFSGEKYKEYINRMARTLFAEPDECSFRLNSTADRAAQLLANRGNARCQVKVLVEIHKYRDHTGERSVEKLEEMLLTMDPVLPRMA